MRRTPWKTTGTDTAAMLRKVILYFFTSLSHEGFKVMPVTKESGKNMAFFLIIQYNQE